MTTVYDLEAPLHPPFSPVVVFRTTIQGVKVKTTLTDPWTLQTHAGGRMLGPEERREVETLAGTFTMRTRPVQFIQSVAYERIGKLGPSGWSPLIDRLAYRCAGMVYPEIRPEERVPDDVPWSDAELRAECRWWETPEVLA